MRRAWDALSSLAGLEALGIASAKVLAEGLEASAANITETAATILYLLRFMLYPSPD
jgi:hypothetical protein